MIDLSKLTLPVISLAGALALAPTAASAADNMTPANRAGVAPATMPSVANQISADKLIGEDVDNAAGDEIGEIDSVILDRDGKVAAVIVGVGGFLGIGERNVAIDWNALNIVNRGDDISVVTRLNKGDLEGLQEYVYPENVQRRTAFSDERYALGRDQRLGNNTMAANDRNMNRDTTADRATARNQQMGAATPAAGERVRSDAQGRIYMSSLNGTDVINAAGDKVGEIDDILISRDGKPALLVGVGGFLGMGERKVLLPWDKLNIRQASSRENVSVSVSLNKDQIRAMPEYKEDMNR